MRSIATEIPIDRVKPSPFQPRTVFSEAALKELADSIRQHSVQQAIVVRPMPDETWQIVMGERRWRAAQLAGLRTIPAEIRVFTDDEAAELALVENLCRRDLDPLDEAEAYQRLLDRGLTIPELAKRVSRSPQDVQYKLALLALTAELKEALRFGVITAAQGHELARLSAAGQRRAFTLIRQYGVTKLQRIVSAVNETETQGTLFGLSDEKQRRDAAVKRRFLRQLDRAAQAIGRCFRRGEPTVSTCMSLWEPT